MNFKALFVTFCVVALTACASTGSNVAVTAPSEEMLNVDTNPTYGVGPDDTLSINVWGNQELTVSAPVRPDGHISMPLVGDIKVGGLTPEEISELIEKELSAYIRSPNVTVIVTNLQSTEYLSRIRVTGAVVTNISIPHRSGMTVLDAILAAGGVNEFAASNKTRLYRNTSSGRQAYLVKLDDILRKGEIETNYALAAGDIITVPERIF